MLAKKERLTKSDFDRFFASGRRHHTPLFTLVYTPSADFHGAVVVPKKILKSAVKRNKVRRRMYDVLRRQSCSGGVCGVYILLMKPEGVTAPYTELKEALGTLLGRLQNRR